MDNSEKRKLPSIPNKTGEGKKAEKSPINPQKVLSDGDIGEMSFQQDFLNSILDSLDGRREAIDARCAVMFGVSSIILGFLVTQINKDSFFYPGTSLLRLVLFSVMIILVTMASILGLLLIAPIKRPKEGRKKEGKNISWFYLIANMSEDEYYSEISLLSQADILKESASQVVKISKLLKIRYKRLDLACKLFYAALVMIGAYVVAISLLGI